MAGGRRDDLAAALRAAHDLVEVSAEALGPTLRAHRLTAPTASLLSLLDPAVSPPSMTELARRMRCRPSNVTLLCDQLVATGLVERAASRTDRRRRVVTLTPTGASVRDLVMAEAERSGPLAALAAADLSALRTLLEAALGR